MTSPKRSRIGEFAAELAAVPVADDASLALWRVSDLERHVDRQALLAADDPPEPPYWAHVWSGALVLGVAAPANAGATVELGCGLGLPGLVAARRGARVVFVDRVPVALAFVRASAAANGLSECAFVAADVTRPVLGRRFDLVLAAELVYDRRAFGALARAIADMLAPGGRALLTDAGRIDTRAFYDELDVAGLCWRETAHAVREEGLPLTVRLIEARHR